VPQPILANATDTLIWVVIVRRLNLHLLVVKSAGGIRTIANTTWSYGGQ